LSAVASSDGRAPARVDDVTRIVLRPLSNPLPLGFLALGAGALVLSGLQLGWLSVSEGEAVALILLAFVFPLQLLASVLGYLTRDVVAGTGMGVLSGTWLAIALVMLASPPGSLSGALGLLLLFSGVALLVPVSVATAGKLLPALVLFTAGCRFATTGVYELLGASDGTGWKTASGVVGVVLCVLAVYAAFAMGWEDALRRTVLPVLRRGRGRESVVGNFSEQVRLLEHEAGVREQL
jgi:succinate-acetate transporter protein